MSPAPAQSPVARCVPGWGGGVCRHQSRKGSWAAGWARLLLPEALVSDPADCGSPHSVRAHTCPALQGLQPWRELWLSAPVFDWGGRGPERTCPYLWLGHVSMGTDLAS